VGPRANYYLNGNAIGTGPFVSAIASYETAVGSVASASASVSGTHLAVLGGYQFLLDPGLSLRLGLGVSYAFLPASVAVGSTQSVPTSALGGVGLASELSFGYAF
jgi:hypothetical protein